MTTQTEEKSPFQTTTQNSVSKNPPAEFTYRTMQDDLLNPPKDNKGSNSKTPSAPESNNLAATLAGKNPEIAKSSPNPFLSGPIVSSTMPEKTMETTTKNSTEKFATPPSTKIIEVPAIKLNSVIQEKPSRTAYKIIMSIVILLILGIIGLSGYYFWINNNETKVASETPQPIIETPAPIVETQPEPEVPVIVTPPTEKYSTNTPNFLVLNTAVMGSVEIKNKLKELSDEITKLATKNNYEFVVIDEKNNPTSFSAFTNAAKLNFSPSLVNTFGEKFSIFVYYDGSNTRLGLAVSIAKPDLFTIEMQKQEKTLVTDISMLFLDATPEIKNGIFKDGTYASFKTRYQNLNTQETLSLDYAIVNSQILLGTSKNTLRAMIDKISQ